MKKILIISGIAFLTYHYRDKIFPKGGESSVEENDDTMDNSPGIMFENADIFTKYQNQVIYDLDNYWMLVLDGKLYTFGDQNSLNRWQAANPKKPAAIKVDDHVWLTYSPKFSAGTYKN